MAEHNSKTPRVALVVGSGAVKCAAASLESREREIIAAARLLDDHQIPFAVVSDGKTAIVMDTVSGKRIGEKLDEIPSKHEAQKILAERVLEPLPVNRIEREKLIYRSYDMMNINVKRSLSRG